MIPPNERITIIYIRTLLKISSPYIKVPFFRETAKTQNGVFAEDTLPLMSRTYELPDITIYTISYMRKHIFVYRIKHVCQQQRYR